MSEQDKTQGVNNEQETVQKSTDSSDTSSPSEEKSEEALKLEARKAELEEQVKGLEGTVSSLKEDIVRKRQERRVEDEEQQPVFDKEALLAELEQKFEAKLKPVLEENEKLQKAVLKSNEDALKAKKAQLESINARIASATSSRSSVSQESKQEEVVELPEADLKLAKELGLQNLRYMRDVEVL